MFHPSVLTDESDEINLFLQCEILNLDPNMKNLPFIGSFFVSIFISQFDLSSALLYVLKTVIERFSEKVMIILSVYRNKN